MSWKTKLAKLEKLAAEIMARRPADPRQTARAIVEFLKGLGLPPVCVGLDENGDEIPGFSDPEDPPPFIPLNRPVLRFMRRIRDMDELFALLDDPAAIAACGAEDRQKLEELAAKFSGENRQDWRELFRPIVARPNAPLPPGPR